METTTVKNPLVCDAIDKAGGDSAVAKHFKLTAWAVSKWRQNLPEKRVLDLAALTGFVFTPHQLDPKMYPNPSDGLPAGHEIAESEKVMS